MPDRAQYLARALTARLLNLQTSFAEDAGEEPGRRRRIEEVEKVLAVELGITDGTTAALIEAAVPRMVASRRPADREVAQFAEFLRQRLGARLREA